MTQFNKKTLLMMRLEASAREHSDICTLYSGSRALSEAMIKALMEKGWSFDDAAHAVLGHLERQARDIALELVG